jgi:hypothetical protein
MNRRIAAWTIAAVAVLGLTACSGSPSTSEEPAEDANTTEEAPAETNADQSVADACSVIIAEVSEASSSMSGLDMESAAADPQATVDTFTETVDAIGAAADSISNEEVKVVADALYDQYGQLRDILSAVLIDQDMSAASDMTTLSTDITETATELSTLCAG